MIVPPTSVEPPAGRVTVLTARVQRLPDWKNCAADELEALRYDDAALASGVSEGARRDAPARG
ncbi:MAG TPA: hypothetical protein VMG37_03470 [Solirubrobacteraceae bacterium]|nr:hypothetical protein [Solirubrobacteraceae bacterium]